MKFSKGAEHPVDTRNRSNDKGKEPMRGSSTDSTPHYGREHYVPHYNRASPYTAYDKARPSTADDAVNARNKFRASLLVAASDALGIRFGRRRPPPRQPPTPVILPDVIEISAAHHHDDEDEERNRLKQMAAQAIGIGSFMDPLERHSREDSVTDDEDEERYTTSDSIDGRAAAYSRKSVSAINVGSHSGGGPLSPYESSHSVIPQQALPLGRRFRSGSMMTNHSRSNSLTIAPIPPFPTTVHSLASFKQSAGVFPKYYAPSSLRIFALSKNWKNRYIILSAPATLVTKGQIPAVSYLHLFKTSNRDDIELERLEINEDSVVFVSEEDVGGRHHVIKVGGADVGAMRKEYTHEENGHTMWFLQFNDPIEAQKWITNIKNAILGQRTVRAGLIPAHTLGNNEPRGDMDVMLSIRAHGVVTLPTSSSPKPVIPPITIPQGDLNPNYASSISSRSVRSQQTIPKSPSPGAVSTLKGLFSGAVRPRSGSRATSVYSEIQPERENKEESFTSVGSNLLNMLRTTNATSDTQSINTLQSTSIIQNSHPFSSGSGTSPPIGHRIDRRIINDHQPIQWEQTEPTTLQANTFNKERASKTMSVGALSLQPPPRKRWTSTGAVSSLDHDVSRTIAGTHRRASMSGSIVSVERAETEPPSSPGLQNFQFGTPEQRPRAPSLQSVSTYASGQNGMVLERTSSNTTKRSSGTRSTRRWSRPGTLPARMTPPIDPPPAIPTLQPPAPIHSNSSELTPSPISSQSSHKSVVSALPSFANKRASVSSARSINSYSTSNSHTGSISTSSHISPIIIRASSSHRASMPPPRPAPTSALPPAPTEVSKYQDGLKSLESIPSNNKATFRASVGGHRTFRLSTMISAPKPPPSTTLPPTPDEPEYKKHRRSSSQSSTNGTNPPSTKLETIPASPVPPPKTISPFPPPVGPLPPTPDAPPSPPAPPKRSTSLKQRLRILSAPSGPGNGKQSPARLSLMRPSTAGSMSSMNMMTTTTPMTHMSPPATPIAEKITMFQNDPSFLQMYTPVMQPKSAPMALAVEGVKVPPDSLVDEIPSLLPPPRRGSKQLLESELLALESLKNRLRVTEAEAEKPTEQGEEETTELSSSLFTPITPSDGEPRYLSLSRPGSVISHQSQQSQELLDIDCDSPREEAEDEGAPSPRQPHHLSLSNPGSVVSLGVIET